MNASPSTFAEQQAAAAAAIAAPEVPVAPARPSAPWVYVKLVGVALLWGGTFIAGRIASQAMPLMLAATGRFAVATILLLITAWKAEGGLPRLNRAQLVGTAALGLTGIFLYNICFFAALARMPAGRTALFVALNPVVTALASAVLLRERLGARKWLGIGIALAGAAIVIGRGDLTGMLFDLGPSFGSGELLMLGAVISWAAYTLIGRTVLRGLTPIAATTYAVLWGLALLATGALFDSSSVNWSGLGWQVWTAIVYLGAFGTVVGFIWYYEGVRAIGPARTAVFNNLVPAFGIALAALLLGEPILVSMVVGGLVTVMGVTLTNR